MPSSWSCLQKSELFIGSPTALKNGFWNVLKLRRGESTDFPLTGSMLRQNTCRVVGLVRKDQGYPLAVRAPQKMALVTCWN
jgi:hypothetical protein